MFGINEELIKLQKNNTPIRVSVVGAGSMGSGMVAQMTMAPGMEVNIIVDKNIERATSAYEIAGVDKNQIVVCQSLQDAERALAAGKKVCSSKPELVWSMNQTDVVVEATGEPAFYAECALNAIMNKKHIVTLSVEGDVCIGHILKMLADNAGVVYTGIYGDEPGSIKNLYDEAQALGFEIVAAGRSDFGGSRLEWNKETILKPLRESSMSPIQYNPAMYASFCDGSKTNEECCMVANATGLMPDVRGMHGPVVSFQDFSHKVPELLRKKEDGGILDNTGIVERIDKPEGVPVISTVWVFVVVRAQNDYQKVQMAWEPTEGSNRIFYTPYHYIGVQAPISVAYAAIHNQPSIAPKGKSRAADVITIAKKDLEKGDVIDEIGGFCVAGRIEKARIVRKEKLLPYALAKGAKLNRSVEKGKYLTYSDVQLENDQSLTMQLRRLQESLFGDL